MRALRPWKVLMGLVSYNLVHKPLKVLG
jgi:hypothetical protein